MDLEAGARLGSYQIESLIGRGSMGEVWQALDSKLDRRVAIKVLPDEFANDHTRLERFEREARLLASLNHPNIGAIYGFEESAGTRYLVLELIDGATLAERIRQDGALAAEDAIDIALQITEALGAAHAKGVVHRDLKPANIKVTEEGRVKVLDFGLAKAPVSARRDGRDSSTLTEDGTESGGLLGTGPYMSPEQVKGQEADQTCDIWALGCVFFEMLTGRRLFDGETFGDILAAVLRNEPDLERLPDGGTPAVRQFIRRSLSKDKRLRLHDMADARLELLEIREELATRHVVVPETTRDRLRSWERRFWAMGLLVALVLIAVLVSRVLPGPEAVELRVDIVTPSTTEPTSLAISPDGRRLVYRAVSGDRERLWIRSLEDGSTLALEGTDGALFPFWSPDGSSIGFFAEEELRRVDVETGLIESLASAPEGRGGSWSPNGTIVFAANLAGPLYAVAASGAGGPRQLTSIVAGEQLSHRYPRFLPDGEHFLYYLTGTDETTGVYLGRVDGTVTKRIVDSDAAAVYTRSGHLMFVRDTTLFAQAFDLTEFALEGEEFRVAEQLLLNGSNLAAVSASLNGPFVFRTGTTGGPRQFVWVDRSGREIETVGDPIPDAFNANLSPDGARIAFQRTRGGNDDLWLIDQGVSPIRLTTAPEEETSPIWSPDGTRLVFSRRPGVVFDLYERAVDEDMATFLLTTGLNNSATDWHPEGEFVLYRSPDPETGWDVWAFDRSGSESIPVVRSGFDERDAQFSPDGEWIAYQSDESGQFEIYVEPFPGPGGRRKVSSDGGAQVRWHPSGRELYYVAEDSQLMAVPIQLDSVSASVLVGTPVGLFQTEIGGYVQGILRQQYMVSADGDRFLMHNVTERPTTNAVTLVLRWQPESN